MTEHMSVSLNIYLKPRLNKKYHATFSFIIMIIFGGASHILLL